MKHQSYSCALGCPVEATLDVIGGKWKGVILYHLLDGKKRSGQLRRLIPSITQRMLTLQLRELENSGVIHRQVYAQVPPKVEYSLTEFGQTLKPIVNLMHDWGLEYIQRLDDALQIEQSVELGSIEQTQQNRASNL